MNRPKLSLESYGLENRPVIAQVPKELQKINLPIYRVGATAGHSCKDLEAVRGLFPNRPTSPSRLMSCTSAWPTHRRMSP